MIVLTTSIFALAAWPSVAAADVTLSNGKIGGATSTSSPPGGVLPASVQGVVNSGTWSSTRWTIGSGTGSETGCYEHSNWASGTHTVDFTSNNKNTVTAPGNPTNYDVTYTAYTDNSCSGQAGEFILTNALHVTAPGTNPNLAERCGINLMLVLDESGSIASSGATGAVRNATKAFLGALSGTGSRVSIIDFSTSAARPILYTTVTADSISQTFVPYIDNTNPGGPGYNPSGWTNWEAAFDEVGKANGQGTKADLVVFMTDGDPTARNKDGGGEITGLTEGDVTALQRAEQESNEVKLPPTGSPPGIEGLARLRAGGRPGGAKSQERQPAEGGLRVRPIPRQPVRRVGFHAHGGLRPAGGGATPDRPRALRVLGDRHQVGG